MTMLKYLGNKLNKHSYTGPVTHTQYRFSSHANSNTKQVDPQDAILMAQRPDFEIVGDKARSVRPSVHMEKVSPSSLVLDPAEFTIKNLGAALVGLSVNDLNLIRDKEITDSDRVGALDVIHTAIVTAGGG